MSSASASGVQLFALEEGPLASLLGDHHDERVAVESGAALGGRVDSVGGVEGRQLATVAP